MNFGHVIYGIMFTTIIVSIILTLFESGRTPKVFGADDDWQIKHYGFCYSQIGRIISHYHKHETEMISQLATNEYNYQYSYKTGLIYITINDDICIRGYPIRSRFDLGQFDFGVINPKTKKWKLVKYKNLTDKQRETMIMVWNHIVEVDSLVKMS